MNDTLGPARSSAVVAVSWGLIGGLSIVASHAFGPPRTRATMIILAYAGTVMGSAVTARHAGSYMRRFGLGLGAYMLATLVMYGDLVTFVNPHAFDAPFSELAWRLGFISGLGIVATAIPLALGASIGRFDGGRGASRAPLKENLAHRGDSDRHGDTLRQTDAAGLVSPVVLHS